MNIEHGHRPHSRKCPHVCGVCVCKSTTLENAQYIISNGMGCVVGIGGIEGMVVVWSLPRCVCVQCATVGRRQVGVVGGGVAGNGNCMLSGRLPCQCKSASRYNQWLFFTVYMRKVFYMCIRRKVVYR